jgi:hypothetical protein
MPRLLRRIPILTLLLGWFAAPAMAQSCAADDFAKAVDSAGAALRRFNAENAPRLQEKLKALKAAKGWSETDYEERAIEILHDARIEAFDAQSNELLAKIDTIGANVSDPPDCGKLAELQAAGIELLATMRAKSAHMTQKVDAMLGTRPEPRVAAVPPPAAKPSPPAAAPAPKPAPKSAAANKLDDVPKSWSTTTQIEPSAAQAPPAPIPPGAVVVEEDGYTIDEIKEATRGFFGSISTGLASVIEHAFAKSGRPTAYVLGQEGGGAFLAGLRYGEGTLFLRRGGAQRIYWHGPSIGYDIGAAGSRTMFLIYKARTAEELYRRFTGIDGSAYLVGGVGITFLTNGRVVMAPIRSGLGIRLGASIGYIRFTGGPTWNPF